MNTALSALINALLNDAAPEVRVAAAIALGAEVDRAVWESVVNALVHVLQNDADARVREEVAKVLGKIGQMPPPPQPSSKMRRPDNQVRQVESMLSVARRAAQLIILLPAVISAILAALAILAKAFGLAP